MPTSIWIALAVSLIAGVGAISASPAGAGDPGQPTLRVNINDDCIEGGQFAPNRPVSVKVRDDAGNVMWSAPSGARTDAKGFISFGHEEYTGDRYCEPPSPPNLVPGMEVTIDDGTPGGRKDLVLRNVTIDDLDPDADTAAGTAPEGPHVAEKSDLFFALYNADNRGVGEAEIVYHGGGNWFVDFGALGANVQPGGWVDAFAWDADGDATTADRFLTAVSLQASSVSSRAARALVVERGAKVRLTGKLSAGQASCTRRKRVKLLNVTGGHSAVVRSDRTDGRGRYSFIKTVKRTTSFKVRYQGGKRCQRSVSRVRTVRVARS